jgi:hypothetical protein
MTTFSRVVPFLALGAFALVVPLAGGCSSGNGGSGGSFGCNESSGGLSTCFSYAGLNSDQQSQAQKACTQGNGSVVSACPTAGLVGCCTLTVQGLSVDECYYYGSASTDQQACTQASGTWSAGMPGGSSGGGSGSSSGSSSGGGSGSSSGSSSGGTSSAYCSLTVQGQTACIIFSNLTSAELSAADQSCTSQGGTTVSSCPSSGVVGCCTMVNSGISAEECLYFGTASADQSQCTQSGGTWSTSM